MKQLSVDELTTKLGAFLVEFGLLKPTEPQFSRLVTILHDRLGRFDEFPTLSGWADELTEYSSTQLIFKKSTREATIRGFKAASIKLETADPVVWDLVDQLTDQLTEVVTDNQLTNGDVFWPVRMALTGLDQSPSPVECLWVLGREESLRRLKLAGLKLSEMSA